LPLHRRDLQMLTLDEARDLYEENREENHALLAQYFPDLLKQLIDYETNLVKPALAKLVNVSTKPLVQLSDLPARKHPPHL
jgi:hypothetical protein